jgi:hypothetical protein
MLITGENSSYVIKPFGKLSLQIPVQREGGQSREAAKHTHRYIVLLRSPL